MTDLSELEIRTEIYTWLLEHGPKTENQIADQFTILPGQAKAHLNAMNRMSLVVKQVDSSWRPLVEGVDWGGYGWKQH